MSNKNAAKIMEHLMVDGIYPTRRNLNERDKIIKDNLRERLSDSEIKRHEFKEQQIVAKFVTVRRSEVDYLGLNEYLYNLGLLVPLINLDYKRISENLFLFEQIEMYQNEPDYYVRPNFNKLGRSKNKPEPFDVDHWDTKDLINEIRPLQSKLLHYESLYNDARAKMEKCPELKESKKLSHKYGSVSMIEKERTYDIQSIYKEMGKDLLIEYGKLNNEKLEKLILNGTITKNEIDQFKTTVDLRLDFVVTTFEAEQRMFKELDRRRIVSQANSLRA